MPIKAERMHLYPGGSIYSTEWKELRGRILLRAGHSCEQCLAPNGALICRGADGDAGTYILEDGEVRDAITGKRLGVARGSEYSGTFVKIILTIAHLDHNETNNHPDNLRAWCQRCHNTHDAPHRRANAAKTRRAKLAAGDLFPEQSA